MILRLGTALACVVLTMFALAPHAQAENLKEAERARWARSVGNVLKSTRYPMPVECISSFCTTDMATVSFDILPDGTVTNVKISKSSRDEIVDRHAIDFIKKLSPLPASPTTWTYPEIMHYSFQYGFGNPQWRIPGDPGAPSIDDLQSRRDLRTNFPLNTNRGQSDTPATQNSDPVAEHRECVNSVSGAVRGDVTEANRLCSERN
ncbi:MAG: energy transducer TonB [Parvibaculum sp.]|nr:energy transducer TonB [Parvibaculum sp.]